MKSINMEVFCVTDYFIPGFKGGGPIRTLDNMRRQIAGQITLSIYTRDRDLGSSTPYQDIETNRWMETRDGPIYYACPNAFGPRGIRKALAAREVDLVYLNSFFSPKSSIGIHLTLRRVAPKTPILLAPRGEFSPGALAVKRYKKRAFLMLARLLGLYRDVFWHASTEMEARDILRQFPNAANRIHVAPDPVLDMSPDMSPLAVAKEVGHLRIVFISRISPMKNLDGLLRTLQTVRVSVQFDIFGPIEDDAYWQECKDLIATLPGNIRVGIHGPIAPEMVSSTFARYDLFAFPTLGENFGHVIFESLRAGTPVLVSDQTPWKPDPAGAINVLPLTARGAWSSAIEDAASRNAEQQLSLRSASVRYARAYLASSDSLAANLKMMVDVANTLPVKAQ